MKKFTILLAGAAVLALATVPAFAEEGSCVGLPKLVQPPTSGAVAVFGLVAGDKTCKLDSTSDAAAIKVVADAVKNKSTASHTCDGVLAPSKDGATKLVAKACAPTPADADSAADPGSDATAPTGDTKPAGEGTAN